MLKVSFELKKLKLMNFKSYLDLSKRYDLTLSRL